MFYPSGEKELIYVVKQYFKLKKEFDDILDVIYVETLSNFDHKKKSLTKFVDEYYQSYLKEHIARETKKLNKLNRSLKNYKDKYLGDIFFYLFSIRGLYVEGEGVIDYFFYKRWVDSFEDKLK